MTTQQYDPQQNVKIDITEAAINYFISHLHKQPDKQGIRIGITKSGCSGFKYEIEFIQEIDNNDEKININPDLTLFISQDAKAHLQGTQIDFVKEGLNASIQFNNPNAKDLCGCGESFSL